MDSLVSICIPTYKQSALFERCLQSIDAQSYKQVEVLVSDDSPDNAVKIVADRYARQLKISYHKNDNALGSPANWNAALKRAKGEFVMLLHHDDFFTDEFSLGKLIIPFKQNQSIDFVFARNSAIDVLSRKISFKESYFLKYYKNPYLLLTGNYIGAPSNVILKSSVVETYNTKYKWIVDVEFYIRLFKKKRRFVYLDEELITIGVHEGQISNECVNNNSILLNEYITYAADNHLNPKSISIYDFYWRLLRNAEVRSITDLQSFGLSFELIPEFVKQIVSFQSAIPTPFLNRGVTSKALMLICYTRSLLS